MRKNALILYFILLSVSVFLSSCQPRLHFFSHQGTVFGTYYNIRYEAESDQLTAIENAFVRLDTSLSMFNESSLLSRINRGETMETNDLFEHVYETALWLSEISNGAFDITVAPLVNAWGFGFQNQSNVTTELIDSLRSYVGYQSITLENHHLIKQHPQTMLDASAIAKGYACDLVADVLRKAGASNLLVDIGGEVVAEGHNEKGTPWRVGITKPIDDASCTKQELQEIIQTSHIAMATSGNYRRFYYEGGERRSHTIDPRTGYPVQHNLLSATVIASDCMTADAIATACMVLGPDSALQLISSINNPASPISCYFIVGDSAGMHVITQGMEQYLQ